MVRSSGHHRKRSRSRSLTPDHKRSKSSRDYDKDRLRRRSRSRDRIRRSRSRDRKKDKKFSESRVRSKPLKLKRRSRSRSRSKSKDKSIKKDEKKETKAEDEPFDPTNLDKVTGNEDEEWVVTDVIEEPSIEDNGNIMEEYDYEADEDDVYSRTSSPAQVSSRHSNSSHDVNNQQHEESLVTEEQNKEEEIPPNDQNNPSDENLTGNKENNAERDENLTEKEAIPGDEISTAEKEKIQSIVSSLKGLSSDHKQKLKLLSDQHKTDTLKSRRHSYNWLHNDVHHSEEIVKITKDHIKQSMKFDKELHELRIKNEIARHKAEMEVIRTQLNYWKNKN